jgi:tetraacyldisaccharide 4'-kinase
MHLAGSRFRNLARADVEVAPEHFEGKRVVAIAGIGYPARFFAHLERLGVSFTARPFPDHHAFTASDISAPDADAVVMTEKDAVKCAAFASHIHWTLPVDAHIDPQLGETVLRQLRIGARS